MIVLASGLQERGLPLAAKLDEKVAKLHLLALSAELSVLIQEQGVSIGVKVQGPFQGGNYCH